MTKILSDKFFDGKAGRKVIKAFLVLALVLSAAQVSIVPSSAAATPAACKKVVTEVFNADKLYVSLQYGVVQAAKDYVASNSLTNRLNYNQSYVAAITQANVELNLFIKDAKCYPTSNISQARKSVKTNLTVIANIYNENVNGQLVGDPKKMTTFKPVGLLK